MAAPPNPGPAVQLSLVLKVTFAHGPNNGPHPTIDYDTEVSLVLLLFNSFFCCFQFCLQFWQAS